ncbi:glycoside hydrolase family 43 protein [Pelagicoccus sp. SDUM812002]|uniref:glycoside hydrolase family 43 protein n=1 Tax=Pelagicoccus sp. SDUM812002 TaxID=3041266 RepID=UPI0028107FA9|nr:glycoside hydrolase family 43 protein [Pelagicoccus sp. SDUM812002]MDQ8185765.1 glycoside hydrolase family 43 protein [Pelagicoccus sp. SDUM812002]
MIQNPILPGFNPDPSIVRVGDDYYIATSTFEWFPGVQIHHSRDLANWELITRPLDRSNQLDMIGNPDSGGVWAPCLSHCDGIFYLIYTDVKQWTGTRHKITHNYLVTAIDIRGPWSDPIYLDSSGFDASLFHDSDGHKWYLSMIWDHRLDRNQFAGTLLQEFDPETKKLVGPQRNIFKGSDLKLTEGPHLYQKDGYYYLLTAEGGTSYEHAVTMARSKGIYGPYEIDPDNPFITSRYDPEAKLQKAGHSSLVDTPAGEWYAVHLCGRPIHVDSGSSRENKDSISQRTIKPEQARRCILGRETAIQKVDWPEGGWPKLAHGTCVPAETIESLSTSYGTNRSLRDDFEDDKLNIHFQSLRRPIEPSWLDLKARPGWLRLRGEEPTTSNFRQSLVARRIQSLNTQTTTSVEFYPKNFKHAAGLIAYYDTGNHYYLHISSDEERGRHLAIIRYDAGVYSEFPESAVPLFQETEIYLRVSIKSGQLQFSYSYNQGEWTNIGPTFDSTILSDDYHTLGFTGAFVGVCAQDLSGQRLHADFDWFDYQEL